MNNSRFHADYTVCITYFDILGPGSAFWSAAMLITVGS